LPDSLRVRRQAAPVRQQTQEKLRQAILEGRFLPGERLIERELCELTGVSRTSVREALRQLEAEGLVKILPYKGPVVAEITVEDARHIYQVRAALEGLAGRLFAMRASDEEVEELADAVEQLAVAYESGDIKQMLQAKTEFYQILLTGSGNPLARSMLQSLHDRVNYLRITSLSSPGRPHASLAEIRRIVEAIRSRDPEKAWAACVEHVYNAEAEAVKALQARADLNHFSGDGVKATAARRPETG